MSVDEQGLIELIEYTGFLVDAGEKLAQELRELTSAARATGCELQEAELYLQEWSKLTNPTRANHDD